MSWQRYNLMESLSDKTLAYDITCEFLHWPWTRNYHSDPIVIIHSDSSHKDLTIDLQTSIIAHFWKQRQVEIGKKSSKY